MILSYVEDMIARCQIIVRKFRSSSIASEQLRQLQESMNLPIHKLIISNETRWNSIYNMLERIVVKSNLFCFLLCLFNCLQFIF